MARKGVSIAHLREQLAAREKELKELEARREGLLAELKEVEGGIAALTGHRAVPTRPERSQARQAEPGHPVRRRGALKEAVGQVLGGTQKALGPKEIADALPGVGYISQAKNLTTMVGQVLSAGHEFRRVARGKYRLSRSRRPGTAARKGKKTAAAAGKKSEG